MRAAVDARPDDAALRLHFAGLLEKSGNHEEAVRQAATVLQVNPASEEALRIVMGGAPAGSRERRALG